MSFDELQRPSSRACSSSLQAKSIANVDLDYFTVLGDPAVILNNDNVIERVNLAFLRDISSSVHERRSFTKNFLHPDDVTAVSSLLATFRKPPLPNATLNPLPMPPFLDAEPTQKPIRTRFQTLTLTNQMPRYVTFEWTISQHPTTRYLYLVGRPADTDSKDISRAAELEDFFENAPIALHWLSSEGVVLWANKTEMNFLGYTKEEYIGQPIGQFCADEDVVVEIFKTLGSGNTIHDVPVRMKHKDGTIKHILVDSNVNYHPDGSFFHTRCFIRDDTARRLKEEKFKMQLEAAENANKMKDEFLQSVAHDLRTPMQALLGNLQLLADTRLDETQTEYADTILSAGTELCRMLDNIVDSIRESPSNDTSNLFTFTLQAFDLKVEIENVIKRLAALVNEDDVIISLAWHGSSASKLPRMVLGDPVGLRRVLMNLLGNAIRFTSKGFITVTVKYDRADPSGKAFKINVIDTGIGIAEQDLSMVWKKYWQKPLAPGEMNRKVLGVLGTGGVGLGLHISKMLVEAMGGVIGVESSQQTGRAGSTFWVKLPLEVLEACGMDESDRMSRADHKERPRHSRAPSVHSERHHYSDLPPPQRCQPQPESAGRVQDWIANTSYSQAPDTASVFSESAAGPRAGYRDSRGRPGRLSRQSSFGEEDHYAGSVAENRRLSGSELRDPTAAIQQIMKQSQAAIESIMRVNSSSQFSAPPLYPANNELSGSRDGFGYYGQGPAQRGSFDGGPLREQGWQSQQGPSGQTERCFHPGHGYRSSPPPGDVRYNQDPSSFRPPHAPVYGDPHQHYSTQHHQQNIQPNSYQQNAQETNMQSHRSSSSQLVADDRRSSENRSAPTSRRGSAELYADPNNSLRRVVPHPQPSTQPQPQQPVYLPLTPISPNTRPPLAGHTVAYPNSPQISPLSGQTLYSRNTPLIATPSLATEYAPRGEEPDYFARKEDATHSIIMPVTSSAPGSGGDNEADLMEALRQRHLRVLVVEDNALCQRVVAQILKKIGCSVETANDGVEAVRKWDAVPVEYGSGGWDVILMDIRMPNMDGLSCTSVLREKGFRGPVVAVTAERGEAERHLCEAVGMNAFLSKPVLVKDLVSKLVEFCLPRK
ncbi:hypothetical protein HK097_010994 [Rhizophlyctis rosea]|uniref:Uncharacterized protein n=1 Tax=Rhizophlyctis rosea TaxID=64517 RepID=A0AAD5S6X8_9FUNG|nr:hypothetical protein HK097_010994 [Rhizophlyctis rosea]